MLCLCYNVRMLATLIARSKASDSEVARETGIHRTQVWRYRQGRGVPTAANAQRLMEFFRARGLTVELADVLGLKRRRAA